MVEPSGKLEKLTLNEVVQRSQSFAILDVDITAGLTQVHAQFGDESAFGTVMGIRHL